MEPKNQFRLTEAVETWRSQFQSQSSIAPGDLDELESHLRDSVEELAEGGLSEEEAFLIARQRMGQPALLSTEFRKVHPSRLWTSRVCWMLVGFLSFSLIEDLSNALSKTASMGSSMLGLASLWSNVLGVILLLLPWSLFLLFLSRRCLGKDGSRALPFTWLFDKKPIVSVM